MIIVPEKEALIRKFAGRKIRFYRKKAKMTQDEFGIRLAKELGKKADIQATTISNWEYGRVPIRNLEAIAKVLNVTVDDLIPGEEEFEEELGTKKLTEQEDVSLTLTDEKYKLQSNFRLPVSVEELERYDGEPVWVRSRNSMYSGKWGIVDALRQTIVFKKGVYTKFSDIDGIIYRFPQPFSLPVDAIGRPLAVSEVRKSIEPIWVEIISSDMTEKILMKGWYEYYHNSDCVSNNSGSNLSLSLYGKTWVAITDPCKAQEDKSVKKSRKDCNYKVAVLFTFIITIEKRSFTYLLCTT